MSGGFVKPVLYKMPFFWYTTLKQLPLWSSRKEVIICNIASVSPRHWLTSL